jgi:transposase-like protein
VVLSVLAVDTHGQTIDFLLMQHRDKEAALRFLKKAIRRHGLPETITIDGSDANEAAIKRYNEEHGTTIVIRQIKYLHNIVEQDHRAVKRVTRPMSGFKSFDAAQSILAGVELMHMLKKGQLAVEGGTRTLLQPNSSMRWPPNHSTDGVNYTSTQICDLSLLWASLPQHSRSLWQW